MRLALRLLLVGGLAAMALAAGGIGFVWSQPDAVLRWLGYSAADQRLVTGILVTGTPGRPVVYVTSSDPRFGRGVSGNDEPVDTNSGVISQLVRTHSGWQRSDLVRGLPRSNADHAPNGMALSRDGTTLYIAQGGNTNLGAPAAAFGKVPEYALSAAILSVDLLGAGDRTYDLPTLDDPDRPGIRDESDPFGGNRGLNQARAVAGGPVQVFASGLRNPYDILISQAGLMYTIQNGANPNMGAPPLEGRAGRCTNDPHEGGLREVDTLHLVRENGYYGHPNPTRAECDRVPPREREALTTFPASTNGLSEYLATNLDGSLLGDVIAVALDGNVYRLELDAAGQRVLRKEVLARLGSPLDVTAQGDGAVFPGTVWIAQYGEYGGGAGESRITVLEPRDAASRGWRRLPPTGPPRQEVSFVAAGGRFYLAGDDRRQQMYDPDTRRWTDVAPLPRALDHIQGVAVAGRIYYIGGLRDWPGPHASTVFVYDLATDRFSQGTPMPRGRGAGGVVAHRGKIYYAGGLHDGRAVHWFDAYDPVRDTWSRLRDLPRARDHFQAVVVGDSLFAIGGRQGDFGTEVAETDAYDFSSQSWRSDLAPIPTRRGGFAAAALGASIYAIGGETTEGTMSSVEVYDTRRDAWRAADPMPTARHGIQAAVCGGGVFVAAGGKTAGGNDPTAAFEAFSPGDEASCGRLVDAGPVLTIPLQTERREWHRPDQSHLAAIRSGRPPLRGPAERPHQGADGRAAAGRRLRRDGDRDHRPHPVDPQPQRRRIIRDELHEGDARAPRSPAPVSGKRILVVACGLTGLLLAGFLAARTLDVRELLGLRTTESATGVSGCRNAQNVFLPFGLASAAGRWRGLPPMPIAQDELRATASGELVYVGSGLEERRPGAELTSTAVFFVFDPERKTYRRLPPLPRRVDHPAFVSAQGALYLIGGFHDNRPTTDAFTYSPRTGEWTELPRCRRLGDPRPPPQSGSRSTSRAGSAATDRGNRRRWRHWRSTTSRRGSGPVGPTCLRLDTTPERLRPAASSMSSAGGPGTSSPWPWPRRSTPRPTAGAGHLDCPWEQEVWRRSASVDASSPSAAAMTTRSG